MAQSLVRALLQGVPVAGVLFASADLVAARERPEHGDALPVATNVLAGVVLGSLRWVRVRVGLRAAGCISVADWRHAGVPVDAYGGRRDFRRAFAHACGDCL